MLFTGVFLIVSQHDFTFMTELGPGQWVKGLSELMTNNFSFVSEFSLLTWVLLAMSAALNIGQQYSRSYAYRNSEIPPLQRYAFLPNVWQFLVDLLILHTPFGKIQLFGFAVLGVFYTSQLVWGIVASCGKD